MPLFAFNMRRLIAMTHDFIVAIIAWWLAYLFRFDFAIPSDHMAALQQTILVVALIQLAVFFIFGLYRGIWRYASIADLWAITKAVTLVFLLFSFVMFLWMRLETFPRSILVINWFVLMMLLGGPRFFYRLTKDMSFEIGNQYPNPKKIPVLLLGAGDES